jgi:hypothetical protein
VAVFWRWFGAVVATSLARFFCFLGVPAAIFAIGVAILRSAATSGCSFPSRWLAALPKTNLAFSRWLDAVTSFTLSFALLLCPAAITLAALTLLSRKLAQQRLEYQLRRLTVDALKFCINQLSIGKKTGNKQELLTRLLDVLSKSSRGDSYAPSMAKVEQVIADAYSKYTARG